MALNTHRLFENSTSYGSYHSALTVATVQADELRAARDEIRNALRGGLRDWTLHLNKREFFDVALGSTEPPALRPKFRMQGSFSYRTQVEPAWLPPQKIDLDDGMFLPVSYLTNGDQVHPVVVSRGLFRLVEAALGPLCARKKWRLVTDKASCVRVEVSETTHVDVALYAIPDEKFSLMMEEAMLKSNAATASVFRDSLELDEGIYRDIDPNEILLAHRTEGWKPSDPRKLEDWFHEALDEHGEQLRRVCKYLKGWRDFQWEGCRLSSIALMAGVVASYEAAKAEFRDDRDDLAILRVSQSLPGFLASRIPNPVVPGQYLDEGWSMEQRNEYVASASELAKAVYGAVQRSTSPKAAIESLVSVFGSRIPDEETLVQADGRYESTAPAVHRAAEYREQAAAAAINEVKQSGNATKPWGDRDS